MCYYENVHKCISTDFIKYDAQTPNKYQINDVVDDDGDWIHFVQYGKLGF